MPSPRLSEEELRLFSERIARSLADRPQAAPVEEHRERIAALIREMGEATYYQILGIEPTASVLEIHEGFERTARMVHPGNAERVGLAGREGVLQILFERATEAYLTLSFVDRRKPYDRDLGPRLWTVAQQMPRLSRSDEAARLFERARVLARANQVHPAVELLRESVRTTPQPESLALLGTLEAKNPHWLRFAERHLEQALELDAKTAGAAETLVEVRAKRARLAAAQAFEAEDDVQEARFA